jgi:hypothetical protein
MIEFDFTRNRMQNQRIKPQSLSSSDYKAQTLRFRYLPSFFFQLQNVFIVEFLQVGLKHFLHIGLILFLRSNSPAPVYDDTP